METPCPSRRRGPRRTLRLARAASLTALALAALGACARLEPRRADVCGNQTLEPDAGEDCDGQEGCGAPGTEHACRFTCSPADGTGCPEAEGFACGVDGVCRRPSGRFEELTELVTSFTKDLQTGDINGDGCHEILHTTHLGTGITALPSRALGYCPASSMELPSGPPPPAEQATPPSLMFADLTTDGLPELLLAARGSHGDGLLVHIADETPTVTPLLYTAVRVSSSRARPLRVKHLGSDVLLLFLSEYNLTTPADVTAVVDPAMLPEPLGAKLSGSLDSIAFLHAVDLDPGDPATPDPAACDEVIAGIAGDSKVHLYRVCGDGGSLVFAETDPVELANGAKIRERNAALNLVDLDQNGALDLVLNTTNSELHVAYGLGGGAFHSAPPGPDTVADQRTGVLALPPPFAAIHAELVDPGNRFVVGDFFDVTPGLEWSALPCPSAKETGSPGCEKHSGACESVIADVDADGHLDIVFTLGADPSIIVARGGKGSEAHLSLLPTQCPPRSLTAGDFDGDGIDDVAFFDPVVVDGPSVSMLSIAYGRAFAVPEDPVASGRLELGSGLAAGKFEPGVAGLQIYATRDAVDPAKSVPGMGPGGMGPGGMRPGSKGLGAGVALVTDRGERVASAPFYFPGAGPPTNENLRPVEIVASTAGRFATAAGSSSAFGVAAVTRDLAHPEAPAGTPGTERLWLLLPRANGSSLEAPKAPGQNIAAPPCDACVLVSVENDGDGIDEVLLLGEDQAIVYAVAGDTLAERLTFPTAHPYRSLRAGDAPPQKYAPRPLVADLDGDGRADVLLRAADGMLVVLWGREGGGFDEVAFDPALELPDCKEDEEKCTPCEGTEVCVPALIDVGGDAAPELAVLSADGVDFFDIVVDEASMKRSFRHRSRPQGSGLQGLPPESDFTAIRSGDFDGDGVGDLVLMRTSGFIYVLRGISEMQARNLPGLE